MKKLILGLALISVLGCDNSFHAASKGQLLELQNPESMTPSKFLITIPVHYNTPYTSTMKTYVNSDVEFSDFRLPAKAFQGGTPPWAFMVSLVDKDLVDLEVENLGVPSEFAKFYPSKCSLASFGIESEQICAVTMFPISRGKECDPPGYLPDDWVIKDSAFKVTAIYKDNTKRSIRVTFVNGCVTTSQRFSADRQPQSIENSQFQSIALVFGFAMFLISFLFLFARMRKTGKST